LLHVGALGAFGLALPGLLRANPEQKRGSDTNAGFGRARACIVVFLSGGPPQQETWDPKPDAPAEVRGIFKPIATSVPGFQVCELMPRLAKQAHRWCAIRSVSTQDHSHASSIYWTFTGRPHAPRNTESVKPGPPNDSPHFGSCVRRLLGDRGPLPAFLTLPEQLIGNDFAVPQGQFAGYLGRNADPWLLTCDPAATPFRLPALEPPADVSALRVAGRADLLEQLDRSKLDAGTVELHRTKAFELMRTPAARKAFDLEQEPLAIRERYGKHKFGQSLLLGRRLIEAGVRLVQVNWPREPGDMQTNNPLWDTHSNNNPRLKDALMPPMDQAVSALIDDLAGRGLLDETLVVWMGEFGRTPKFNSNGGRDHWGGVYSVAFAGAGVRGGQYIGASDRLGANPKESPVTPQDLLATVYHALGLEASREIQDVLGRPQAITQGDVVRGLF
jgi:hypothetical protein